jgi:hypothetical protein
LNLEDPKKSLPYPRIIDTKIDSPKVPGHVARMEEGGVLSTF